MKRIILTIAVTVVAGIRLSYSVLTFGALADLEAERLPLAGAAFFLEAEPEALLCCFVFFFAICRNLLMPSGSG